MEATQLLEFKTFKEIKIVNKHYVMRIRKVGGVFERRVYWKALHKRRKWEVCDKSFVLNVLNHYKDCLIFH